VTQPGAPQNQLTLLCKCAAQIAQIGFGQAAPPGVPEGHAGQVSAEQSAAIGLVMISSHLARIEHVFGNCTLAILVSAYQPAGRNWDSDASLAG